MGVGRPNREEAVCLSRHVNIIHFFPVSGLAMSYPSVLGSSQSKLWKFSGSVLHLRGDLLAGDPQRTSLSTNHAEGKRPKSSRLGASGKAASICSCVRMPFRKLR
jgi:hypothetical protein